MSYIPIEKIVPQYVDGNGKPYSGAVLKAYAAGTTTNIPFAIDTSGNTLSSTITLNTSGYPVVSGNVIIPHLDQNYKLALYPNQQSADSNTNPVWIVDNIAISSTTLSGGQLTGVGNGTTRDSAASVGQIQDGGLLYLGTTAGVDNGYTVSPSPAITAYSNKMAFSVKIHATNTTNPKPYLQLNNIANPATNAVIKKLDASKAEIDIETSDMLAGGIYDFQRNSSDNTWILLNPEKSFFINPSIASAQNIVKASFAGYGVSYLERPIEIKNGTAANSIEFSKGIINFDDGSGQTVLISVMVKHLYTTAWEKGTNKGGLFGGTPANALISADSFYHCFVIYNPTTGEVDCGFDTALNAPNKPTGFTKYKRIASFRTDSSRNIIPGSYIFDRKGGYYFNYKDPINSFYRIDSSGTENVVIAVPALPVVAYMITRVEQTSLGSYAFINLYQKNGSYPLISTGSNNNGNQYANGYIPIADGDSTIKVVFGGNYSRKVWVHTLGWYDPCLYTPIPLEFNLEALSVPNGNTISNNTGSGSANAGGSNTQVQYNKNGLFGGNAGFTYDETNNSLSITGSLKLGALTASTLLASDSSKNIQSLPLLTYPSLDEIARIKGLSVELQPKLTSLQNDLNGKAPNAIFTGANSVTDGTNGLVPKPLIADQQKYLKGDGTWGFFSPAGLNTQIQFNDNGAFAGSAGFVYDKTNDILVLNKINCNTMLSTERLNVRNDLIVNRLTVNEKIFLKDVNLGTSLFVIKVGEALTAERTINITCDDSDVNLNLKHAANSFIGATGSTNGVKGLVPAPTTNDVGKFLKSDGTWTAVSSGSVTNPGGSTSQVQFNDGGIFAGNSNFTFNKDTNTLTVANIVSNTIDSKANDAAFTGATVSTDGSRGLVPKPLIADRQKFLKGDGSWADVSVAVNPSGSNTQIQFNDNGAFAGSSGLTFNKTDNSLAVSGNIKSDALTASQLLASDGSKNIQSLSTATYPSLTEISYSKGLTGPIQTQITGKADDVVFVGDSGSGGVKGLVPAPAAGDSAKVLGANGQWVNLPTVKNPGGADTQIQFNDGSNFGGNSGLTYNKATFALSVTGNINSDSLTASQLLGTDASKNIQSLSTATYPSLTELTYLKGTTSNLQTQIAAKANDVAFAGATISVNGVKGLVPAPLIADRLRFLRGDGTWADISVSATNPAGSDTQVQFNDNGAFGANAGFVYNKTTNALTVSGSLNSGALTASQLLASDASKNIQSLSTIIYPSLDELKHVKGGTSAFQSQIDAKAPIASPTFTGTVKGVSIPFSFAISDETTAITTGTSKITFRVPYACTLTAVRASLSTASTSGNPTFDINKNGVSMLSTTLSIDANEKTSVTAVTAAVISTSSIADDDEITIDIDAAGTGAKGAKITLYLTRV